MYVIVSWPFFEVGEHICGFTAKGRANTYAVRMVWRACVLRTAKAAVEMVEHEEWREILQS
jgi:hypothetical protein